MRIIHLLVPVIATATLHLVGCSDSQNTDQTKSSENPTQVQKAESAESKPAESKPAESKPAESKPVGMKSSTVGSEAAKTSQTTELLPAKTTPTANGNDGYLGVLAVFMSGALLLCMFAIAGLLRWRKLTDGGMMAWTPASLMDSLTDHQTKAIHKLDKHLAEAHKRIVDGLIALDDGQQRHQESVKLLDVELTKKDRLLQELTKVTVNEYRDQYVRTVCKLTTFMNALKNQVREGKLTAVDAIDFLSDELEESILESGVQVYEPICGASFRSVKTDLCDVINLDAVQGQNSDELVVTRVSRKAIFRVVAPSGEVIVYRKSEIEIGKRQGA